MIARHRISLTAVAVSLLVAVFAFTASAQTNRATFPADFDKYVLYATYDRGSSKEEAFAKPATLEIAKSGALLPPGTQIVLGIWQDYKLTGYFVMEKGAGCKPRGVRTGASIMIYAVLRSHWMETGSLPVAAAGRPVSANLGQTRTSQFLNG